MTTPAQPLANTTTPVAYQELTQFRRLRARALTIAGTGIAVAVTAGAGSVAVTFANGRAEQDANYGVTVTPNWDTTVYVTSKTTTGFTINFGTVAPGGGGLVDYWTFRT